ncbi:MAG: hypothetical protein M3145_00775 [Pseudomonadota bacterium]|nr:hypothetical protein [Pseudomonadota bacterium]
MDVRGLEFRRAVGHNDVEDGLPVLAIEGKVANVAARTVEMPLLRLALRGARREEIDAWIVEPPKGAADPGESVRFKAPLPASPSEA